MTNPLIQANLLTKNYQIPKLDTGLTGIVKHLFSPKFEERKAVKNLSFTVESGGIIGYIGPNGAGKSTTIKLLTGLLVPTSGSVEVLNCEPFKNRSILTHKMGVLMGQKSQLWWDLPVKDSYEILRLIYNIPQDVYQSWLDQLIEIVDIRELLDQPVRLLSLGQRMRADLVATFLHKPELVFLDEPTIGLDIVTKQKIIDFLLYMNQTYQTTIFLTTHDLQDVEKVCSRMLLIHEGELCYDGKISAFIESFQSKGRLVLETKDGKEPVLPSGFQFLERQLEKWEYIYDKDQYSDKDVFEQLSQVENIRNMNMKDLDLSWVIRLWYSTEEKK